MKTIWKSAFHCRKRTSGLYSFYRRSHLGFLLTFALFNELEPLATAPAGPGPLITDFPLFRLFCHGTPNQYSGKALY
jgi:hypothetical protein